MILRSPLEEDNEEYGDVEDWDPGIGRWKGIQCRVDELVSIELEDFDDPGIGRLNLSYGERFFGDDGKICDKFPSMSDIVTASINSTAAIA